MADRPTPDEGAPRRPGIPLGRVLGVPVFLHASWLLLAILVTVTYGQLVQRTQDLQPSAAYAFGFLFVVCLVVSVLLHELGHALTARRYGVGVKGITLELLGGYTEMDGDAPRPGVELTVSLAGPVVSLVLGFVALGGAVLLPDGTLVHQLAVQLAVSNILVAVFNALPGLPLDGGRALRALVWWVTGDRHAGSRVAGWIGRGVAVLTLVVALYLTYAQGLSLFSLIFMALVAVTLWQGASASIAHGRLGARLPSVNLRQMAHPVFSVTAGTPLSEASRRVAESSRPDAVLAVADASGRLVALVHEQAAAAVPPDRRPWVPVESVARALDPRRSLPADLTGEDVVRAVQANPAPTYLVVSGENVVGVLRTADLARLLNS